MREGGGLNEAGGTKLSGYSAIQRIDIFSERLKSIDNRDIELLNFNTWVLIVIQHACLESSIKKSLSGV